MGKLAVDGRWHVGFENGMICNDIYFHHQFYLKNANFQLMACIHYTGYSAVCTKTLKGLREQKAWMEIQNLQFSQILWVYLTRKTCGQHQFISLNILGHPTVHPSHFCLAKSPCQPRFSRIFSLMSCCCCCNQLCMKVIPPPSLNTQCCNRRPLCSTFTFENVSSTIKTSFLILCNFLMRTLQCFQKKIL